MNTSPLKSLAIAGLSLTLLGGASLLKAKEAPQKESQMLSQWTGEWTTEAEIYLEPGKPPVKSNGTEKSRMIGPYWLVSEGESDVMGMKYSVLTTIGYDAKKKKYVGTTVDAFSSHMHKYEGTFDATGKILSLEGETPDPTNPARMMKMREVCESKTTDHKIFRTSVQSADGKWTPIMTINFRRKK
jgi:hypothetical protein